jgi:hypothetical protein
LKKILPLDNISRELAWGTKWNIIDNHIDITDTGDSIRVSFDTAWAPSIPVTAKIARLFPNADITHEYDEEGEDFRGVVKFHNGFGTEYCFSTCHFNSVDPVFL